MPDLATEAPPSAKTQTERRWPVLWRITFRFSFVYLLLYCLPTTDGRISIVPSLPFNTDFLVGWFAWPWQKLCPWVAIHIFHLSGPVTQYHPTGSGDTTLDYIQVFCFLVISAMAALVWSILDKKRTHYDSLYPWLRLVVRFTLAFTMLGYGFAKVFPLQFGSAPSLLKLTETIGEASPMGLLWTMMAASTAYTFFCGLAETLAGLLLFFKRTLTLGALASAAVMLNVVLLNFCYDVPVKLYSAHLFCMSLFLLIADAGSLWNFFVLHKTAQLHGVWVPPWERRTLRIARIVLQALIICSVLYTTIKGNWDSIKEQAVAQAVKPPIEGMWSRVEKDTSSTWQTVVFEPGSTIVRLPDRSSLFLKPIYGKDKTTFKVENMRSGAQGEIHYQQTDPTHMILHGTLDKKPVSAALIRIEAKTFLLTNRGFHWISEDPFNR